MIAPTEYLIARLDLISDQLMGLPQVTATVREAAQALRSLQQENIEAVQKERLYGQGIINERDKWIVELIQERDSLVALVREAIEEAIPDALIFGMHTNADTWIRAKDDFQAFTARARSALTGSAQG